MAEIPKYDASTPPRPSRHDKPKGRILLLTNDIIAQVEKLLPRTLYVETVAAQIGVHRQTLWLWLKSGANEARRREQGEDHDTAFDLHATLFYVVKKTLGNTESDFLSSLQAAGTETWTALAWLLERRFPERWSANRGETRVLLKRIEELEKKLTNAAPNPAHVQAGVEPVASGDNPVIVASPGS